jgi:serine/threonine protein kinase
VSKKYEYFGKYILLEKLATGGMAEIYLARRPGANGIGKFLAIKRILPQFADTEEFIDMFKDEAKIAINLNHSNIVGIHEFGVEKHQFFIVMDYVEGRNMRQILNKMKKNSSKFSIDQIVYMVKEIAAGLDNAHRCLDGTTGKPLNITHRDMSPQNVMVSFEGEIKIVDFGIAKAESKMETTRAGTLKGKFGYMSPEQAEGQPMDLRTDIFSLGIVLWELLANDRLFIANNEINTLKKIRDCQIPSLKKINPGIPQELERITNKALARDRNLRYQTSAALHRDLNRFLNRQYPDFSTQDFSVFIKTLFSDEILQVRKRLIEYAKIPFQQQNTSTGLTPLPPSLNGDEEESSFVTVAPQQSTKESTFTESNVKFNQDEGPIERDKDPNSFTGQPFQPEQETKNDKLNQKTNNFRVLDKDKVKTALKNKMQVDISQNPYSLEPSQGEYTGLTSITHSKYNASRYTSDKFRPLEPKKSNLIMNIVITAVMALGLYSASAMMFKDQLSGVIAATDPVLGPLHSLLNVEPPKTIDMASLCKQDPANEACQKNGGSIATPKPPVVELPEVPAGPSYREIIVSSSPSGAEIYVDGQNTGLITPSRIEIPTHKPFDLTVRRTGYMEYIRPQLDGGEIGPKIEVTLQKAVVGYLDIDVRPPKNAKVYINKREVKGSLPITRYPVPANTSLVIQAFDPYSKSSSQRVVTVEKNKRMSVILDLKRRTPSQN